jgi:hypothetical protein
VGNDLAAVGTGDLFNRANKGDREAMDALAERFKDDPKGLIYACRGDLPGVITEFIIGSVFEEDQLALKRAVSMAEPDTARATAG